MNLLIIGGTRFYGRHLTTAALKAGHRVALFNRGRSNPGLFPDAEEIVGDRRADLELLKGREWDSVVDTCGYFPKDVAASSEVLKDATGIYCFISSVSVYADPSSPASEESGLAEPLAAEQTEITGENYGPLKVACENAVREVFGEKSLNLRPGLIVGPHDPTDRFTYWIRRIVRGGDVLAPEPKNAPVQFVDARDLAEFTLRLLEEGSGGNFNVTGPADPTSMEAFLELTRSTLNPGATISWLPEDFLLANQVGPWMELPLWLPDVTGASGLQRTDISRALNAGLNLQPIEQTVADTAEWDRDRDQTQMAAGMRPERENEILQKWSAAQKG